MAAAAVCEKEGDDIIGGFVVDIEDEAKGEAMVVKIGLEALADEGKGMKKLDGMGELARLGVWEVEKELRNRWDGSGKFDEGAFLE